MSLDLDVTMWTERLAIGPVRDVLRELEHAPDPGRVIAALADHAEKLGISDLGRALTVTERLVDAADHLADAGVRARVRRARAQALAYSNRFEETLLVLAQAVVLADAAGLALEAATSRMTTLHALARLGRLDEAVQAGLLARQVFEAHGEPLLAARTDINLGVVLRMKDEPGSALEHFHNARERVSGYPLLAAQLENNAAEAMLDLNQFDAAIAAFGRALGFFRSAGVTRAQAIVEGNLADLASRRGQIQDALLHFENARANLGTDAAGDVARLLAERAEALHSAGLFAEAVHDYQQAIPALDQCQMSREAARARAGLGGAMIMLGRHEEAVPFLDASAAAFRALGNPVGEAHALAAMAEVALSRDDPLEASSLLKRGLANVQGRAADSARLQLRLAAPAVVCGQLDEADALIEAAVSAARQIDLPPLLTAALYARARLRRGQGRAQESLADLLASINQVERVRGTLRAGSLRGPFLAAAVAVYGEAVSQLLDAGGPSSVDEAFAISERGRSRALLDLMETSRTRGPANGQTSQEPLARQRAALQGDLSALYSRLDPERASVPSPVQLAQWRAAVASTERQLREVEHRMASTTRFADVLAEPVRAPELSRLLDDRTAVLAYFEDGDAISAFVIRRSGARAIRKIVPTSIARERVSELYFQIDRAVARGLSGGRVSDGMTRDAVVALEGVRGAVVSPMIDYVAGAQRLAVVPHGFLHAVPFQALLQSSGINATPSTVQVPSASILRTLIGRASQPHGQGVLVVGVPDAAAPLIAEEARRVHAAVGRGSLLLGDDATASAVANHSARTGLIHIAAHGRFNFSDPHSSGVRLADRWFTARDIADLDLRGACVVLSGCSTGRAAIDAANESTGLARSALAAGARAVAISLWPVHDASTINMMAVAASSLYTEGRPDLPAAMARAQREAGTSGHPAAWAAFVVIGAP